MTPRGYHDVDLAPFKAAHERSGETFAAVARRMGRDQAQVARLLGNRKGNAHCSWATAERLCEAMGLDPVDFGL